MLLGIEIGGTKLQLGVCDQSPETIVELVRTDVDLARGASGILESIEKQAIVLARKYPLRHVGIGFGGPIDAKHGVVTCSHQVKGWNQFPLARWCQETLGLAATMANDCDAAAVAEATYGAGKGSDSVFYVTVGTGVGGGLVLGGKLFGANRPAAAEIGHLRPGLHDDRPELTVESMCAGPAIAAAATARINGQVSRSLDSLRKQMAMVGRMSLEKQLENARQTEAEFLQDLVDRCGGDVDKLTAKQVAQAAAEGNEVAREVIEHAAVVLGWGVAQVITLLAIETVVIGGGVSMIGETHFFAPLRDSVDRYVFPPLAKTYQIVPASLGENVVVIGALSIARDACANRS